MHAPTPYNGSAVMGTTSCPEMIRVLYPPHYAIGSQIRAREVLGEVSKTLCNWLPNSGAGSIGCQFGQGKSLVTMHINDAYIRTSKNQMEKYER